MQPLIKLADGHFRGLYGNCFVISFALFSKISYNIICILKIVYLTKLEMFSGWSIIQKFVTFLYSFLLIISVLTKLKKSDLTKNSPSGLASRSLHDFNFSYWITPFPSERWDNTNFFIFVSQTLESFKILIEKFWTRLYNVRFFKLKYLLDAKEVRNCW